MKILKISFVTILTFLLIVVAFSVFYLGDVVKKAIQDVGSDVLGVNVTVDHVNVSLIAGSVKISGLTIDNPEGYKSQRAIYLGQASVKLVPTSIFSDVIRINHVRIVEPEINYEAKIGGTNIGSIRNNINANSPADNDNAQTPTSDSQEPIAESDSKPAKKVVIDEFLITGAKASAILNTGVKDVSKQVLLPEIKLNNIGGDSKPTDFRTVANKVLSSLLVSLGKSDLSSITNMIGGQLIDTKESIKEGVKKIENKLKGFFK